MATRFFYTLWWLKVLVQRFMCEDRHDWHWGAHICRRCGVTAEQAFDHTLKYRPPEHMLWRPWGRV